MAEQPTIVTAAVLVIGNEVLSGRTQDININFLASGLTDIGVRLAEARVIADDETAIVDALNHCRAQYDYVFTTGGIGPTHDDITTACVAKAFGVAVKRHPVAEQILRDRYANSDLELNAARLKMADIPDGAELIDNPVSGAPGFRLENVFVLAGVPRIAQAMFGSLKHQLTGGDPMVSITVSAHVPEGELADGLTQIQQRFADVELGSYPYFRDSLLGVSIIARSTNLARAQAAVQEAAVLMRDLGGEPILS